MPNINDINGVTVANLAKLDAVLKANISKVNGLTLSAFTGLLDETYGSGAVAAFSIRQLKSGVTVAMRVRRDTGGGTGHDDEADVEWDTSFTTPRISLDSPISNASTGVTSSTLGQFCNAGTVGGTTYSNPDSLAVSASLFCTSWKDQSGNNNHAVPSSAFQQPLLRQQTSGNNLELLNGNPYLRRNQNTTNFRLTTTLTNSDLDIWTTCTAYSAVSAFLETDGNDVLFIAQNDTSAHTVRMGTPTYYIDGSSFTGTTRAQLLTGMGGFGNQTLLNALNVDVSDAVYTEFGWSAVSIPSHEQQEILIFSTDKSGDRTDLETNINSDYLIYQPTDAPTSGLLATYTGAAAAYSVRQLSDKAVIAMRIRRDSDDEERNIGFDSNGDLDTTAISDFCGTANGYVTRWWDQSTNSEHANQDTDTLQPQIYNGTAVFTNGSPARPEIRATTNARMVLGTLAHDVDRKYFGAVTASVSSFCVLFGSNNTADYELLAQSGDTQSIFDVGGAIVNRNGVQWYNPPTLDKDRNDVWNDFSSQSIVMVDHALATVTGRTTQLGYATNGIPMFHMQELIIYPTGTSHAVSDIEDAINSYFQVYT